MIKHAINCPWIGAGNTIGERQWGKGGRGRTRKSGRPFAAEPLLDRPPWPQRDTQSCRPEVRRNSIHQHDSPDAEASPITVRQESSQERQTRACRPSGRLARSTKGNEPQDTRPVSLPLSSNSSPRMAAVVRATEHGSFAPTTGPPAEESGGSDSAQTRQSAAPQDDP
jgi:hypothetical protein